MKPHFSRSLFLILLLAGAASAQGIIVPGPCGRCPPRPIPRPYPMPVALKVKSVQITTRIDSEAATTHVQQVFENDSRYTLEGTYFFPIPESASVEDFAIYDGDKRMSGEVVEHGKARQIYNQIVRKLRDPGLLEYSGKNLFEASVYPIGPRSTKRIDIAYSEVLKAEGGTVSYRYPLGVGRHLAQAPIGQISASVEIISPVDLKNIYSPSHNISITRTTDRKARLSFEGSGSDAQRDFQLYYSLSDKEFGIALLTHREPGKDGYFLILLSPKTSPAENDRDPKDIVFVLDTSGSMSGEKIDNAKAALKFGVESLGERDRFNVISFSGEEHLMSDGLIEATKEGKAKGLAFISDLRAEGGTNINDVLVAAFKQFKPSDRPKMLVFLTDGQPTVGVTDPGQIHKNVADANTSHVRLFSFGVGYDVNTTLLDKLSAANGGTSDYIEPSENLETKVSNFFAKVNYPMLTDLRLDLGGVEADTMYPRSLPDLFKGSQLSIVGRYKNSLKDATIRLSGKTRGRQETFSYTGKTFPAEDRQSEFLPRLWATRRVGYLLEQIRINGENPELVDEITALGTRYGIVTPYTSFLVTEDSGDARGGEPIPMPREVYKDMIRRMPGGTAGGVSMPQGADAVKASRAQNKLTISQVVILPDQRLPSIRAVGAKTFRLKDGVWIDTEYAEDRQLPEVKVEFGSEEFFKLVDQEPKLADYFAIGVKVVVVFNLRVYRVE
ncbi:MAG TPA: VIT domain-containing protein [Blastocatellia bacterium]|nr:VIT domain-containing protein [Blastocatellia bacterium]